MQTPLSTIIKAWKRRDDERTDDFIIAVGRADQERGVDRLEVIEQALGPEGAQLYEEGRRLVDPGPAP